MLENLIYYVILIVVTFFFMQILTNEKKKLSIVRYNFSMLFGFYNFKKCKGNHFMWRSYDNIV